MRNVISDLVPTADTFTFPAPGFSPHEVDEAGCRLLRELMMFHNEREVGLTMPRIALSHSMTLTRRSLMRV